MKLKSLLLTTLVVFGAQVANASEWKKVATIGADEYSLDAKSLKLTSDAPTTIEAIIAQKVGKASGKLKAGDKVFSVMSYNCDDESFQTGISQHYDTANKLKNEITEKQRDFTYYDLSDSKAQKVLFGLVCQNADELRKSFIPVVDTGVYND